MRHGVGRLGQGSQATHPPPRLSHTHPDAQPNRRASGLSTWSPCWYWKAILIAAGAWAGTFTSPAPALIPPHTNQGLVSLRTPL